MFWELGVKDTAERPGQFQTWPCQYPGRVGLPRPFGGRSGRQLTPVQREGSRTRLARAGGQLEGSGEGVPRQSRPQVLGPSQKLGFPPREKLDFQAAQKAFLSNVVNTLFCKIALQIHGGSSL